MKKNKTDNIMFLIHPTQWEDFDILALGDCSILRTLAQKEKHFHLIKKSKFGGVSVLVMDTCNTLRDAMNCIRAYRKDYEKLYDKLHGIV